MKSLAKFECMEMRIHYFPNGGFKQENNKIKTDPNQITPNRSLNFIKYQNSMSKFVIVKVHRTNKHKP